MSDRRWHNLSDRGHGSFYAYTYEDGDPYPGLPNTWAAAVKYLSDHGWIAAVHTADGLETNGPYKTLHTARQAAVKRLREVESNG